MKKENYQPVSCEFMSMIEAHVAKKTNGSVTYFKGPEDIVKSDGHVVSLERKGGEEFLTMANNDKIRLDKIVTFYGIPGPAYDVYNSFANSCMECNYSLI